MAGYTIRPTRMANWRGQRLRCFSLTRSSRDLK